MTGFDLDRFDDAQKSSWPDAIAELKAGQKQSHWMWFIFPQLAGLGTSPTAVHYAIRSADEACAYLAHPLLGQRLRESVIAMLAHQGMRPETILGGIDALKFRSSLTLFEAAADDPTLFADALDAFYGGERDQRTLALLSVRDS